jgi:peptidoglycan/LPS O-acetylase OafA/YrhL
MKLRHYKELDGVRGIAALMVMFFHFFQDVTTGNSFLATVQKYSAFGWTGVSLFFVLSGFLITRILLNSKERPSYFLNFYARRTLRIFPLYYLFLVIFYFLVPALEHLPIAPFNQQIWYWVYLQNFATTFYWPNAGPEHFWSLAIEEHFYLFWPLLVYFLDKKKTKVAIISIIFISIATRSVMLANHIDVSRFTFARLDELALGSLLAIWELEGKLKDIDGRKFLLLFVLTVIPTIALWTLTTGLAIDAIQISKFILMALCYFGLIGYILTIKEEHFIKKVLGIRALTYTGKISYGLYVYHPLCFYLLGKYLSIGSVFLSFIVRFGFVYATASLSYYLFESRFLKLKKKFPSAIHKTTSINHR